MPVLPSISFLTMIAIIGQIVLNFVLAIVAAAGRSNLLFNLIFLLVSLSLSVTVPVLAARSMQRGRRFAPLLVTAVGLWGCYLLVLRQDAVNWIFAMIGVAGVVTVWLPTSRNFLRERRVEILESKNGGSPQDRSS